MTEPERTDENESAYCRGARTVLMIRECGLPTTAEIAERCGLSRQMAHRMLETLSLAFPIYQEAGRWLWNGGERAWAVCDLVERIRHDHAALDALVQELRDM